MSLAGFSVKRPVLTTMVALTAVLIGAVSLTRLPIDLLPDIEYPYITVYVSYPNASPQAMEQLVAEPLENAVATVPGIEEITSSSGEGITSVRLQFEWGTDLNVAATDVRSAIEDEYEDPPEDAERPEVRKYDVSDSPVMLIGVFSGIDPITLRSIIDNRLIYRLQQIPGVAQLDVWGGPEREIQVQLDPQRIQALDLSLAGIVETIDNANLNRPGGSIERGYTEFTVRVPGRFDSLEEIRNTVVALRDGAPVKLSQVATVRDTRKRVTRIIRINGEPGIRLAVRKQSGANTVEVAKRLHAEIAQINDDYPQIRLRPLFDNSQYIENSIANTTNSMIIGSLLAVGVLLFFLRNLRATLVIATSIPVSVITTFALVYFADFTLNLMTLGGLALGVGLMVDSAIVVLENIVRRHEEEGGTPEAAATRGTDQVAAPVVSGTLTTLAIFVPMVFAEGLAGQLFKQLAYVVAFALTCGLIAALTLVPMLGARLLRARTVTMPGPLHRLGEAIGRGLEWLEQRYARLLRGAVARPWSVIGTAFAALLLALAAVPQLGTEFLPATDVGEIEVQVEMSPGTRLETVERATGEVLPVIREQVPEAVNTVVSIGSSSYRPEEAATAEIDIALPPRGERERSSAEIAASLRAAIGPVAGAEVRVSAEPPYYVRALTDSEEALAIEVRGFDFDTLTALASEIRRRILDVPGLTDIRLSLSGGDPQQLVRVNRQRAADQGVSLATVAGTVEIAVGGRIASRFLDEGDEVDIRVVYENNETLAPAALLDLRVPTAGGGLIPLGSVATLARDTGPVVIDRKDQTRYTSVWANVVGRDLGSVVADVEAALADMPIPDNYSIIMGGDYEQQRDAFSSLLWSLLLAVALVYMVIASQYESLRDPLIVMGSVPLALIGVVAALLLTDTTLNAQSLIGCVILVGIAVNNAILLVDQAQQLRAEGYALHPALQEAGRRRLRPILMTAMTTVLAMLPLAIGAGEGGETQAPLARAVIGGLLVSTLITLVLIPALYAWVHRREDGSPEAS